MSRASVAERTRLSVFLAKGMARKLLGRLTGFSLARLPFLPGAPDRLLIAPQDLRTADSTRASEIYAGRFSFGGKVVVCDARSPFEVKAPSEDWSVALHGFSWLRHLRAADSGITRANARALVDEWISLQSSGDAAARRPEVTARRIISWISQAPLVLDDSDVRFYRRFLRSLTRQVRQLRHTAADARDGVPRLLSMIAVMYAIALHGEPGAAHQGRRQAPERRAGTADPARRRAHQPQSRRADRAAGRSPAAADDVHLPQRAAAAGADAMRSTG